MRRSLRGIVASCGAVGILTIVFINRFATSPKESITIPKVDQPRNLPLSWYKNPNGEVWKPQKVLVFAYARSGSSLTGDIINHSTDVYYAFEPLNIQTSMINYKKAQLHQQILQAFFHCNFTTTTMPYMNRQFLHRYNETKPLERCFRYMRNTTRVMFQACIKFAEQICKNHRMKEVKVIRLSMYEVGQLMTLNPDLAVIFLLRDPRPSMWSRMKVFKTPTLESLPSVASYMCHRMKTDLEDSKKLFGLHPERMRYVRYEDLVQNPVKVSQNIYKFLNLPWTQQTEILIRKQTLGCSGADCNQTNTKSPRTPRFKKPNNKEFQKFAFSVTRTNSSLAAAQWKEDIPANALRAVQNVCSDILTLLGYRRIENLDDIGKTSARADTMSFKFVKQLPFRADLNYD